MCIGEIKMAANSKGVRPTTLKHACSSKTNQVYITPCTHAQSKAVVVSEYQ